jgi:hypothetical protein
MNAFETRDLRKALGSRTIAKSQSVGPECGTAPSPITPHRIQQAAFVGLALAANLLAMMLPASAWPHFAWIAAFGSVVLLCFPLEPMSSFATLGSRVGGTGGLAHYD